VVVEVVLAIVELSLDVDVEETDPVAAVPDEVTILEDDDPETVFTDIVGPEGVVPDGDVSGEMEDAVKPVLEGPESLKPAIREVACPELTVKVEPLSPPGSLLLVEAPA